MTGRASSCRAALPIVLTVACVQTLAAQEWTRFRGPNGAGISRATTVPVQFTERDYNWRIKLPGEGHSSPVIWGTRLFITSADQEQGRRHLHCIDTKDGRPVWSRAFDFKPYSRHQFNSYASSTPAVDAERVYINWATHESYTVYAFDHAGGPVWQRDLGPYPTQHGIAGSPIVVDDVVAVAVEPEDVGGAFYAGLDRRTGEVRWRAPRKGVSPTPYSTPMVYEPAPGERQILFSGTVSALTSVDPTNGEVLWETGPLFSLRTVGSPVMAGGLLFVGCGAGGGGNHAFAVRPGSILRAPTTAYRIPRGTAYVPTFLGLGDLLFSWGDGGIVTCYRAATGETVWSERVGGNFFGSPICVDGKLYAMSAKGELIVIEASEQFRLLGRMDLGEPSHATPAVSSGVLYLRTLSHLISVGGVSRENPKEGKQRP